MKKSDGSKLKDLYESMKPPTPDELAVKAEMSTSNLRKVFTNKAADEAVRRVATVLNSCRREMLSKLQCKSSA